MGDWGPATGVWIIYGYSCDTYVTAIFADELEARRYCDEKCSWNDVKFVEFGEEIK